MMIFMIQTRAGSMRLPNKVLLPFFQGKEHFEFADRGTTACS